MHNRGEGRPTKAKFLPRGIVEFFVVRKGVEPIDGDKCQYLAEHQDPAHVGDECEISVVADPQLVGEGAAACQWAKLETVPTYACLVLPLLPWQVGHRLVGSAKQDGCPAVETGWEVEEVEETDEDKGEGADEPGDGCGQLEDLSSSSDDAGDEQRCGGGFRREVAIIFFSYRLFHHEDESVCEGGETRFEAIKEEFPEVRAVTAANGDKREKDANPE